LFFGLFEKILNSASELRLPAEAAPTAIKTKFARQAGHIALLRSFLWRAGFLQILRQAIERAFPELSIFLDPCGRKLERLRIQLHFVDASVTPTAQESRFLENAEMFRNGRERHVVAARKMGHAFIALAEMEKNAATGGIGKGGERSI
jgi:hypothetical protein